MTEERLKLTPIKLLKTDPKGHLDIEHTVVQLVERMNLIINLIHEYNRQIQERQSAFDRVVENFREACGVRIARDEEMGV